MNDSIKKQFFLGVRWNIFGSFFYESLKLLHQILLVKYMNFENYGVLGGLFSFIFLSINIANLGAEQSISAFVLDFLESKKAFKRLLVLFISINVLSLFAASVLFNLFIPAKLYDSLIFEYKIPQLLIFVEGLRIFFRSLLHSLNVHKYPVIVESLITTLYFSITWTFFFLGKTKVSTFFVLTLYLLCSICVVTLFIMRAFKLYEKLPSNNIDNNRHKNLLIRIFRARCYNYLINLSRNFFTGNFIVAILVSRFSLGDVGLFKFASYIADAIRGIAHAIINFSGGSFLGLLRNSDIESKRAGFKIINESLSNIIFFLALVLLTNMGLLYIFQKAFISFSLFTAAIFLVLALLEQYTSVYTQFFTVEEHLLPLVFQKASELSLIFYILYICNHNTAITVLFSLLVVKFFSFATLATEAFYSWKLTPTILPSFRFLSFCVIITIFTNYIVCLFIALR